MYFTGHFGDVGAYGGWEEILLQYLSINSNWIWSLTFFLFHYFCKQRTVKNVWTIIGCYTCSWIRYCNIWDVLTSVFLFKSLPFSRQNVSTSQIVVFGWLKTPKVFFTGPIIYLFWKMFCHWISTRDVPQLQIIFRRGKISYNMKNNYGNKL